MKLKTKKISKTEYIYWPRYMTLEEFEKHRKRSDIEINPFIVNDKEEKNRCIDYVKYIREYGLYAEDGYYPRVPSPDKWRKYGKKRIYIGKGKREKVYKRDNYTCVYCGRKLNEDIDKLVIDHFDPYPNNQNNSIDNLVTSCNDCNYLKWKYIFGSIEDCRNFFYKWSPKFKKYVKIKIKKKESKQKTKTKTNRKNK